MGSCPLVARDNDRRVSPRVAPERVDSRVLTRDRYDSQSGKVFEHAEQLRRQGHRVLTAHDGPSGLELLCEHTTQTWPSSISDCPASTVARSRVPRALPPTARPAHRNDRPWPGQ